MDKSISAFLDSGESTIRHKALDDCNAIEQCAAEFVFAPAISSSISLCDLTATIEKLAERRGLLRAREIAEMKESLEEFIDKKSSLTCGGEEKKAPCSKKPESGDADKKTPTKQGPAEKNCSKVWNPQLPS